MRVVDVLVDRHALLDRALHADQADAELVLEQLAHGAHAAVAQVVDVVEPAEPRFSLMRYRTTARMSSWSMTRLLEGLVQLELDVDLEAADLGQVVLAGVEEQAVEQVLADSWVGGSPGRRRR